MKTKRIIRRHTEKTTPSSKAEQRATLADNKKLKAPKKVHPLSIFDPEIKEVDEAAAQFLGPESPIYIERDAKIDSVAGKPYQKFLQRYTIERLFESQEEFDCLISRRCEEYLDFLDQEFDQGYLNAVRELAFLAHQAIERLNSWAEKDADLLAVVAQDYSHWPVLCNDTYLTQDQKDRLKKIRLDSARVNIVSAKKIGNNPPVPRQWALFLLKEIRNLRLSQGIDDWPTPLGSNMGNQLSKDWGLTAVLSAQFQKRGGNSRRLISLRENKSKHQQILHEAKNLPKFTRDSAKHWWALAKMMFLVMTNNRPWEFSGLENYAKTTKVTRFKKADGTKRADVLKGIQPAFLHLAAD